MLLNFADFIYLFILFYFCRWRRRWTTCSSTLPKSSSRSPRTRTTRQHIQTHSHTFPCMLPRGAWRDAHFLLREHFLYSVHAARAEGLYSFQYWWPLSVTRVRGGGSVEGEKGKKGRKGRKVFLHFNRPKILRHHLMAIPARTIGAAHSSAVVSFIPLIAACSKQPSWWNQMNPLKNTLCRS